jgi:hypothetical protein
MTEWLIGDSAQDAVRHRHNIRCCTPGGPNVPEFFGLSFCRPRRNTLICPNIKAALVPLRDTVGVYF